MRDHFIDEAGESKGPNVLDDAADGIALTADSADDGDFARANTACSAASAALIPMPVLGEPADESFINFDNPTELLDGLISKCGSDPMGHVPSSFEGTEAHVTPKLASADALLAGEHQVNDAEPIPEGLIRVLENSADEHREPIAVGSTFLALPMPATRRQVIDGRGLPQRGQRTPSGHLRAFR